MSTHCCCGGPSFRHFVSAQEQKERLEEYEAQLQKELDGVKEHIQKLEKE
jgi:hypothetical protein